MDSGFIPGVWRDVDNEVADVGGWFFWFRPVRIFCEGGRDLHIAAWHGEGECAVTIVCEFDVLATSGDAEVIELIGVVWQNGDRHFVAFGGVAVNANRAVVANARRDLMAILAGVWDLVGGEGDLCAGGAVGCVFCFCDANLDLAFTVDAHCACAGVNLGRAADNFPAQHTFAGTAAGCEGELVTNVHLIR